MKFITLVIKGEIDIRSTEASIRVDLSERYGIASHSHDKLLSLPVRALTEEAVEKAWVQV